MTNRLEYRFDGEYLRLFLSRKKLTHEAAAKILGMNKNTLNKAVNSGDITMDSFFKIVNTFLIPPTQLIKIHSSEENQEEGYPLAGETSTSAQVAEKLSHYETTEEEAETLHYQFIYARDEEICLLRTLCNNYSDQIQLLKAKLAQYEGIDPSSNKEENL